MNENMARRILNTFLILVLVAINMLMAAAYYVQKEYGIKQEARFVAYRLAEELKHSSRDLTTAVRAFVATGDPRYRVEFQDILDRRNGLKARPDGRTISLRNLMVIENFSQDELELLAIAENRSNELAKIEIQAINAVYGIFPDENGNYVIKKAPDRVLGVQLVYDFNYRRSVEGIMDPIRRFEDMVINRTESTAIKYQFYLKAILISVFVLILIFTLSVFLSTYLKGRG